jgi:hypothetical protein
MMADGAYINEQILSMLSTVRYESNVFIFFEDGAVATTTIGTSLIVLMVLAVVVVVVVFFPFRMSSLVMPSATNLS